MSETMPTDLYQAIIKVAKNHIKGYYPSDMILVENYKENAKFTYFKLYRAFIIHDEECTTIVNKKSLLECHGTFISVYSVNKKKQLISQLQLLGLRAY